MEMAPAASERSRAVLGCLVAIVAGAMACATTPTTPREGPVLAFLHRTGGIAGLSDRVEVLPNGTLVYECERHCGPAGRFVCGAVDEPETRAKMARVLELTATSAFESLPEKIGEDECCDRYAYQVGRVDARGHTLAVKTYSGAEWPAVLAEAIDSLECLLTHARLCEPPTVRIAPSR